MPRTCASISRLVAQTGRRPSSTLERRNSHELGRLMKLYDLFRARAAASPESLAVTDGKLSLTYDELDIGVFGAAARMRGVVGTLENPDAQPVVAMCMGNSIETLQTVLAASLLRFKLCVLDPNLSASELETLLRDCRPAAVFSQPAFAPKLMAVKQALQFRLHLEAAQSG